MSTKNPALFEDELPPMDVAYLPEGIASSEGGAGGVSSHTGYGRLYWFSFFADQCSPIVYARSLKELPAEGQTFEDHSWGVGSGGVKTMTSGTGSTKKFAPMPVPSTTRPGGAALKVVDEKSRGSGTGIGANGVEEDDTVNLW
ncbi:hypothetical protein FRC09_004046 [Ceratobasidium sp. 395]|nr:hypothetical protein FRC09_004046 [Ceratobasidium sp. 395]